MDLFTPIVKKKPIMILVTKDFSGLGFAKICTEQGYPTFLAFENDKIEEDEQEAFEMVGEEMVEKIEFPEIFKERNKYKEARWIFDGNHHSKEAEQLRKEGFMYVFGGHDLTDKMEHDRHFGTSLVEKAGLKIPETQKFSDTASGIEFLEANEDRAWVFKPDEPDEKAWVTTVPDNEQDDKANEEIRKFLASMGNGKGDYILQERKKGIEVNVEIWLYEGKPFFAHANFENKKKLNKELGKLIGCAHDIEHVIPLESKIIRDTLMKLIKLPEFKGFTGMVDMNLIVADREYYFLEFCGRFGYNSHPNLFINLGIKSFPEIMNDFLEGKITNFQNNFRPGFGASILMSIDEPVLGLPIIIPQELENNFYHYDTYRNGDDYCLAGYAKECGIICAHDYDLKSAADRVLGNFDKIHYPGRGGRTDINLTDYETNPWERLIAANAMKLFDV